MDGAWAMWRRVAENWLEGRTGKEGPACRGRGRCGGVEGPRGPVGTGEVGPKARGWLWLQDLGRAATALGKANTLDWKRHVLFVALLCHVASAAERYYSTPSL